MRRFRFPKGLKTEDVVLERIGEIKDANGAPKPGVVETLASRKVEIRPLKRPVQPPPIVDGKTVNLATHFLRDDVPVIWTDPRTGQERHDLDISWRATWTPSDGSSPRTLRPIGPSRFCPKVVQWVTDCYEVKP